jgi:hypothetical protein
MAKKQSAGEASAEAAKKRRPQKKSAAPKAGAKKPPPRPAKKARKREAPAQAELPIAGRASAAELDADVVEDADIIAESSVELPIYDIVVGVAPLSEIEPDNRVTRTMALRLGFIAERCKDLRHRAM